MASSSPLHLFFLLLFTIFTLDHFAAAQTSFRPRALVLPVTKDAATLQYIARLQQRTPLVPVNLTLDLGAAFLWVDCDAGYVSSTYRPVRCRTAQCSLARSTACGDCSGGPRPGCNRDTCVLFPGNTVTKVSTTGEVAQDVLSIQSTNGSNPSRRVTAPNFIFSCAPTFLLNGLARGVSGMAGLGRSRIGLPAQLAATFSFKRKFAVCLSSSTSSPGVVFFGDGPYILLLNHEVSQSLIYTKLIVNPVSTAGTSTEGDPSDEYFIKVTSIKINNNPIPINASLLNINKDGVGGTKISTVDPYTVVQTSIYRTVVSSFFNAFNLTRVRSVPPFGDCFNSSNIGSTRVGPAVPSIDLVLESESVFWRMFGANTVVSVRTDVMCLAFIDGGAAPRSSIVIGGYQIENNLLQFDLAASRLGFSSSLLFQQTTCANFNFTSIA